MKYLVIKIMFSMEVNENFFFYLYVDVGCEFEIK